jgi:hypothetical protein
MSDPRSDAEKLAFAVLLFHEPYEWTDQKRKLWREMTGSEEASTKTLCDLARELLHRPRRIIEP